MNKDGSEKGKLFWEGEVGKVNDRNVQSCNRTKYWTRRLAMVQDDGDAYFEALYNGNIEERIALNRHIFDCDRKGNYFRAEPSNRTEQGVRERKSSRMLRQQVRMSLQER